MSIITYPLNGVVYSAEDVATYLCTRTSGVYSKETNFAVSTTGTRQITVAPGLAWINYDDFKGVSVCSREENVLTVPEADNTLNRVDRVVLQFDTSENITAIKLKTGTPAVAAQPPDILQNHNQYELGLCTISVPAGSTAVTAADITDTRADETVCGVMRDGVTGIPTAQLQTQAKAMLDSLQKEVDSKSFYTKAEADAEHAKLQEQLNNIGSLTSRQVYCQSAATSMTIPDEVDYVVLTNSACTTIDDTCAVVARGGSAYITCDDRTDRIKFGTDGTLTLTITSGYYLATSNVLGFRYEVSAAFPCLIGTIAVYISEWNDTTSDPVPDGTAFITLSANTVADAREIPINRGQSYMYRYGLSFETNGTIVTRKSKKSEYLKVNCYKYMTPSEWNAHMTELQSAQADADEMSVDQAYRLTLLELNVSDTDDTDNADNT